MDEEFVFKFEGLLGGFIGYKFNLMSGFIYRGVWWNLKLIN